MYNPTRFSLPSLFPYKVLCCLLLSWLSVAHTQTFELTNSSATSNRQKAIDLLDKIEKIRYSSPSLAQRQVEILLSYESELLQDQATYAQALYWSVWLKSRSSSRYSSYLYLLEEAQIASLIFRENGMHLWLAKCEDLVAGILLGRAFDEPELLGLQDSVVFYLNNANTALRAANNDGEKWPMVQADVLHTTALLHLLQEDLEKADLIFTKALDLYDALGDSAGRAKVLLNQMLYKEATSAKACYQEAIEIYRDLNYPIDETDAYLRYLDYTLKTYRGNGDSTWLIRAEEAMHNHLNSLASSSCELFLRRAELFRLMATVKKDSAQFYTRAFYNFQNAFDIGKSNGNLPCANESARKLVSICSKIDKCDLASEQLAEEFFPAISKYVQASTSKLAAFQHEQINLRNKQRAQQNILLTVGIALFALLASFSYTQYQRNRAQAYKIRLAEEKSEAQQHKLNLAEEKNRRLKMEDITRMARLNRHLIVNSLNNIQGLINCGERKKADKYVGKLGHYISETLMISTDTKIPLKRDFDLHQLFVTLYIYAFPKKLNGCKINLDPSLREKKIKIPALIAQPDVENAIMHGLLNKTTSGTIKISVQPKGTQQLSYIIEDDGVGLEEAKRINEQKNRARPSMGTKIVQHALDTLNQMNAIPVGEEHLHPLGAYREVTPLIHPDGSNAGTRVTITLPFQTENKVV